MRRTQSSPLSRPRVLAGWRRPGRAPARCRDHGLAVPTVVVLLALLGVALVGIGRLSDAVDRRVRAQTAADAAALAGAADGEDAARAVAAANQAKLVQYHDVGGGVEVIVRVGDDVLASARAERTLVDPTGLFGGPPP